MKAKEVHPDVVGEAGEAGFKRLQQEYEEAMKAMKEAETNPGGGYQSEGTRGGGGGGGQHPSGGYGWQAPPGGGQDWQGYHQAGQHQYQYSGSSGSSAPRPPPVPLTPAQRLRNVALAAGGFGGVLMFITAPRSMSSRNYSGGGSAPSSSAVDDDSSLTRKNSAPQREVSNYYKTRNTKSTVRVRGTDTYVSPAEAPKSRSDEEGLGSGVAHLSKLFGGGFSAEAAAPPAPERPVPKPPTPPPTAVAHQAVTILEAVEGAKKTQPTANDTQPGAAGLRPAPIRELAGAKEPVPIGPPIRELAGAKEAVPIGPQPAPSGPQPSPVASPELEPRKVGLGDGA